MQSAKKSTRILSALSLAATAALTAKTAHGASLTLYYGQDSYANSNNGVYVGTGYNANTSASDAVEETQFFSSATAQNVNQSGSPTTINVPVGSYLSLAIDALLTGDTNAAAGAHAKNDVGNEPTFLGLASLGIDITSSDVTGTKLTPIAGATQVNTTVGGLPSYISTGFINGGTSAGQKALAANGGTTANAFSVLPTWSAVRSAGVVQPNQPGFDTAPNSSGGIGTAGASTSPGAFPSAGNTGASGASLGPIEQFASATNTVGYNQATDFGDGFVFKALAAGTVTLTTSAIAGSTAYWTTNGTATKTHLYQPTKFGANDTLGTLPVLVINRRQKR